MGEESSFLIVVEAFEADEEVSLDRFDVVRRAAIVGKIAFDRFWMVEHFLFEQVDLVEAKE